jgi:hypothetical protein
MISYRRIEHKFVAEIPEQLEPGVLYVSMQYATAVHLCCCGCQREVVTPLSPAQWRATFDGENISLYPSIGNWNLPCRSHYILRDGNVLEANAWSDEEVASGQARDRRARTAYYGSKHKKAAAPSEIALLAPRKTWLTTIRDLLSRRR